MTQRKTGPYPFGLDRTAVGSYRVPMTGSGVALCCTWILVALIGCDGGRDDLDNVSAVDGDRCMLTCPVGQRCDRGHCVEDTGCPPRQEPFVRYASQEQGFFYRLRVGVTEYLVNGLPAPGAAFTLINPDGGRFTVDVPHEHSQCLQDLEPCWYQDGLMLTVLRDYELSGETWYPGYEQAFTLPFEARAYPETATRFVLQADDRIAILDTETGNIELRATFQPRDFVGRVPEGSLVAYRDDAGARTFEIAPSQVNAEWEPVVDTELSDLVSHFFVGRPDKWYLVTSPRDDNGYDVFTVALGIKTLVAHGVEPSIGLLRSYHLGWEELEEGHWATGVSWDGEAFSLKRIDLDRAETELLDEVQVPDLDSEVRVAEYPIGCGGFDLLVVNERDQESTEYWVVRLLP